MPSTQKHCQLLRAIYKQPLKKSSSQTQTQTQKSYSNTNSKWENFKNQKRKTQSSIRKSYWHHIENNILGDKNEENFGEAQKKIWKHVKSVKRDRTGTAPLKENGLLVSDPKSKARILNHQYQSVFSKEDSADIPEPNEPESPTMSEIVVTEEGVFKQLSTLQENKASGPDKIPLRILKAAAKPLSRCLTLLYNSSLKSGSLPHDWCTANITPIFKKGERFKPSASQNLSFVA